ncbi:MAG: dihydroorotate dehydrogenase [Planctomycetaceae bacterium]|jgi:dihydroorotate dehydrogenase (NAD+) catalytic subunit|nr:dihydroorotate dehydrogenase [Planctomycetaceae bacterium]
MIPLATLSTLHYQLSTINYYNIVFIFKNPVLVASGTFGYAREMEGVLDLSRLGGIIPKTVTLYPRTGNIPPRTAETASGLLNSIGLDNDGIDDFICNKLPYLKTLNTKIILSIAPKNTEECPVFGEKLGLAAGIDAVELNLSCPNVSGGVDFATDPKLCEKIVSTFRRVTLLPLLVKLSPNVTNIADAARAAEQGGANGISAINTCLGLAVDWRKRCPRLGNGFGGLSGPAIKPIALRCVRQIFKAVKIPVLGIGGIETIDDVMEFFITGASAVQIGTANFYNPTATIQILDALPNALKELGAENIAEIIGTLEM